MMASLEIFVNILSFVQKYLNNKFLNLVDLSFKAGGFQFMGFICPGIGSVTSEIVEYFAKFKTNHYERGKSAKIQ